MTTEVYHLLERTGIQYICLERVRLGQKELSPATVFCSPIDGTSDLPAEKFFPHLIQPLRRNENGEWVGAGNQLVEPGNLFEISGLRALEAFRDRWLPLPYCGMVHENGVLDIHSNDWVRLFYTPSSQRGATGPEYDFVLCVDTQVASSKGSSQNRQDRNAPPCSFLKQHLNVPIELTPTAPAFWNCNHLKTAIAKLGQYTEPEGPLDACPAFSQYIGLLYVLKRFLPRIQISESIGDALDVHLFVDLGNSRTCGITVEHEAGGKLQPEHAFEKLQIRNPRIPNRVLDQSFESRCLFMPSPFDGSYYSDAPCNPRVP